MVKIFVKGVKYRALSNAIFSDEGGEIFAVR